MDLRDQNVNSINIRPSFGSTASFSALNKTVTFGDNYSQTTPQGINSLRMALNLKFNDLVDTESLDLISFLQKQFYYKVQNYNTLGHFTNKRLIPFNYQPFYPYKNNTFNCLTYTHEKIHFDVNSITANLEAISPSLLSNVNDVLATYDLSSSDPASSATIDATISNTSSDRTITLKSGHYLYDPVSYKNYKVLSDNISIPPNENQSITLDNPYRFFEGYSAGKTNHTSLKSSMFIDDPNQFSYFPYSPNYEHGLFPFKMFDFRPDQQVNLLHSPKFKKSNISEAYIKYNLYGFNPNLFNLQVKFTGRNNLEAKAILLFLENHLGFKKFGFHIQKDYLSSISSDANTTPHRQRVSYFYCPEWSHTFKYYNNHEITATFIECIHL